MHCDPLTGMLTSSLLVEFAGLYKFCKNALGVTKRLPGPFDGGGPKRGSDPAENSFIKPVCSEE